jgi:hypothetical protein
MQEMLLNPRQQARDHQKENARATVLSIAREDREAANGSHAHREYPVNSFLGRQVVR